MLFQVLRNNTVYMSTEYEECIPPPEILYQMTEAGYSFRKDNKPWKPPVKQRSAKKKGSDKDEK